MLDQSSPKDSNSCADNVSGSSTPNQMGNIDEVLVQLNREISRSEGESQQGLSNTCNSLQAENVTSQDNDIISNVFNSHNNMSLASDSISLHCPGNVNTVHVSSFLDCKSGNVEYRIRPDVLTQCATANPSSEGNFLWSLTKMIYSPTELIGRNFTGRKNKKMLSPRRKHALIHAYVDCYGRNKNRFMKATNSVNSGIRYLSLKEKCKE
ncbi:hypothetical protein FSP39_009917 [Pinctada imbricata]|uniref:BEN domain-containing protein n=1 Tax=Pinctada imbricata TaxID=66713 RepID=A0AA88YVY8_PINIB|nr:hypothetical protein FSP39_009405 [Pinctada imbricata]KAK3107230.1 hypothetical protein FSP39_009917 [Pinctada imbricata]